MIVKFCLKNNRVPFETRHPWISCGYEMGTTLDACNPLGPCSMENSTF